MADRRIKHVARGERRRDRGVVIVEGVEGIFGGTGIGRKIEHDAELVCIADLAGRDNDLDFHGGGVAFLVAGHEPRDIVRGARTRLPDELTTYIVAWKLCRTWNECHGCLPKLMPALHH